MRRFRLLLLMPLVLAAVLLPGSGRAAEPVVLLKGTVGPGFFITLRDAQNQAVTRVRAGQYAIQVDDRATEHNFHFRGPGGVDQKTEVDTTGTVTWNVTLVDGRYTYNCDPHASSMRGVLNVGAAPAPLPKLNGRVGPKRTIALRTVSGALVKRLAAGTYRIAVRDATRADNFHLLGAGVNKKTGVRFRGTVTWKATFKVGKRYTIRSDAHLRLRRTFTVGAPPPPPPPPT